MFCIDGESCQLLYGLDQKLEFFIRERAVGIERLIFDRQSQRREKLEFVTISK